MQELNFRIFQLHADLCRMLANPARLMILNLLSEGEISVGEIATRLNLPMTAVSQHLRALKDKHLVETRKDKQTVYNSLVDPRILEACSMIRLILIEGMKQRGELAQDVRTDLFLPQGPDRTDEKK